MDGDYDEVEKRLDGVAEFIDDAVPGPGYY